MTKLICILMCVMMCGIWGPPARIVRFLDLYRKVEDCEVRKALETNFNYIQTPIFNISDTDVEDLEKKKPIDKNSQLYSQLFQISQQECMICCAEDDVGFFLAKVNDFPEDNKKLYFFELRYGDNLCRNMACQIHSIDDWFYITLLGVSNAVKCTPPIPGLKLKIQQQAAAITLQDLNDSQATICLRRIVRILDPECPVTILLDLEDMPMQIYMKVLGLCDHDCQNLALAKIIDALKSDKTMINNLEQALRERKKQPALQQNSPNSTVNPDPNIARGPRATASKLISKVQKSSTSSNSSANPFSRPASQDSESVLKIDTKSIEIKLDKSLLRIVLLDENNQPLPIPDIRNVRQIQDLQRIGLLRMDCHAIKFLPAHFNPESNQFDGAPLCTIQAMEAFGGNAVDLSALITAGSMCINQRLDISNEKPDFKENFILTYNTMLNIINGDSSSSSANPAPDPEVIDSTVTYQIHPEVDGITHIAITKPGLNIDINICQDSPNPNCIPNCIADNGMLKNLKTQTPCMLNYNTIWVRFEKNDIEDIIEFPLESQVFDGDINLQGLLIAAYEYANEFDRQGQIQYNEFIENNNPEPLVKRFRDCYDDAVNSLRSESS